MTSQHAACEILHANTYHPRWEVVNLVGDYTRRAFQIEGQITEATPVHCGDTCAVPSALTSR